MNKAEELIEWFNQHGTEETDRYHLEMQFEWFQSDGYIGDTYDLEDQGRWWVSYSAVWELPDHSFVQITWMQPATEKQEQPPNMTIEEVEPYAKTIVKYRRIK